MAKVNATTVVRDPKTLQVVVLLAGDEVPEWAEVGDHLTSTPQAEVESEQEPEQTEQGQDEDDEKPSEKWTNPQIKQYAEDNGIDLGEATTKADMLAAIG